MLNNRNYYMLYMLYNIAFCKYTKYFDIHLFDEMIFNSSSIYMLLLWLNYLFIICVYASKVIYVYISII